MRSQPCMNIQKEYDIVGARQLGRQYAKKVGFGIVDQARITTAISELARNIYLYANNGQICFEVIDNMRQKGLIIIVSDTGPGIEDISKVMQDGYTTSGGLGAGLPGVKRLMNVFSIESDVDTGTKITATKWVR